jgi:hypothetical protein
MDIQVNRNQLERVFIKWLNKNFGNLTPKKRKDKPNVLFYVNSDNEVLMGYDKDNNYLWVSEPRIWLMIESLFHLKYGEIYSIMNLWLKDTYNLERSTLMQMPYTFTLEED